MKFRTLFAVAAIGLASLACGGGGGGGSAGYSLPTVPLCAPFTDLGLPIDDGSVMSCTENAVSISYPAGADQKGLFDKYYSAIKGKAANEIVPASESGGTWTGVLQDGNKMNYALSATNSSMGVYIIIGSNKAPM